MCLVSFRDQLSLFSTHPTDRNIIQVLSTTLPYTDPDDNEAIPLYKPLKTTPTVPADNHSYPHKDRDNHQDPAENNRRHHRRKSPPPKTTTATATTRVKLHCRLAIATYRTRIPSYPAHQLTSRRNSAPENTKLISRPAPQKLRCGSSRWLNSSQATTIRAIIIMSRHNPCAHRSALLVPLCESPYAVQIFALEFVLQWAIASVIFSTERLRYAFTEAETNTCQ